jgi:hypothetical protein
LDAKQATLSFALRDAPKGWFLPPSFENSLLT